MTDLISQNPLTASPCSAPSGSEPTAEGSGLHSLSVSAVLRGQAFGKDFDTWHQAFKSLVEAIVRRRFSNPADQNEVTQEVWIRLEKGVRDYDPSKGQPQTWVSTIARNTTIDALRHKQRRPMKYETDLQAPDGDTPSILDVAASSSRTPSEPWEALGRIERNLKQRIELERALSKLPAPMQEVLRLQHFEGLSLSDIAERLGEPLGTVKSRCSRALKLLRDNPDLEHLKAA